MDLTGSAVALKRCDVITDGAAGRVANVHVLNRVILQTGLFNKLSPLKMILLIYIITI